MIEYFNLQRCSAAAKLPPSQRENFPYGLAHRLGAEPSEAALNLAISERENAEAQERFRATNSI